MSSGTLYCYEEQPKGRIARAVAVLAGLNIDLSKDYVHTVTNKTPEYLAKFPTGKIPAWEGKDGFKLVESAAIARYFASKSPDVSLLGKTREDAALVDQWMMLFTTEIEALTDFMSSTIMRTINNEQVKRGVLMKQHTHLALIDKHLTDREFLVGDSITVADVWVAGLFKRALLLCPINASARAALPNLIRHCENIIQKDGLKEIFGPLVFHEE